MPTVRVVDLRREAGYPLSAPLLAELGGIAERGGKAILLLNRRGLAPAVHCRACGATRRCRNCDVALTLHRDNALRCHHCGAVEKLGETCPACGSSEVARIGAGTQRLEAELQRHVPELERIRLDADAVEKPEQLRDALERFSRADRAVLLGTQMVAKGHHFPGVELAAVIDADTGLGLPDFRAEERTFQLLTQLAGRSGRDAPGRVLVQTFQPDARAVTYAARHDVAGFLAGELDRRRALGYPPFRHLVRIVVSGPELPDALRALEELKAGLPGEELLGPAPLLRLRNRQRAQLVGKTERPRAFATRAAGLLAAAAPAMRRAGLTAVVDVDPQSSLASWQSSAIALVKSTWSRHSPPIVQERRAMPIRSNPFFSSTRCEATLSRKRCRLDAGAGPPRRTRTRRRRRPPPSRGRARSARVDPVADVRRAPQRAADHVAEVERPGDRVAVEHREQPGLVVRRRVRVPPSRSRWHAAV